MHRYRKYRLFIKMWCQKTYFFTFLSKNVSQIYEYCHKNPFVSSCLDFPGFLGLFPGTRDSQKGSSPGTNRDGTFVPTIPSLHRVVSRVTLVLPHFVTFRPSFHITVVSEILCIRSMNNAPVEVLLALTEPAWSKVVAPTLALFTPFETVWVHGWQDV